jgi:hypothetical protein
MIVVKAPREPIVITIGGAPVSTDPAGERTVAGSGASSESGTGSLLGKRYVDATGTLELLCTRAGPGLPAAEGDVLTVKSVTPLPATD